GRYTGLGGEAHFGLSWLQRLWHPARKVLYIQVGVGTGNASNTIQGDYNFWFLPQAEDQLDVSPGGNPGPTARFVKYRPVFPAAPPQGPARRPPAGSRPTSRSAPSSPRPAPGPARGTCWRWPAASTRWPGRSTWASC